MIRSEPESQNSIEISNLLQSVMYYTTDCAINYIPQYKEGQDLIKECYKNPEQRCLAKTQCTTIDGSSQCTTSNSGEKVCDALEKNIRQVIENSLLISEEGVNKAYKFNIYYAPLDEEGPSEKILNFENGEFVNCTSKPGGSHAIAISRFGYGNIDINLELCRG